MAVGTAGFTSMMAVDQLQRHGIAAGEPVVVTGAAGGVGSTAITLLATLGYEVTASTGRVDAQSDALRALGATHVIDRAELAEPPARPLLSERWAGAVDAVGSATLAHVLAEIRYGGAVAACGLAGGNDLPTSVIPFLLRGVTLYGIDSVMCPAERRAATWARLAEVLDTAAARGDDDRGRARRPARPRRRHPRRAHPRPGARGTRRAWPRRAGRGRG